MERYTPRDIKRHTERLLSLMRLDRDIESGYFPIKYYEGVPMKSLHKGVHKAIFSDIRLLDSMGSHKIVESAIELNRKEKEKMG